MAQVDLSKQFIKDIKSLRKEDVKYTYKVWELIADISVNPFNGIGQPEGLRGGMAGYWSRRITQKHRLIYLFKTDIIYLVSCYGHYDDK